MIALSQREDATGISLVEEVEVDADVNFEGREQIIIC